ncbi:MAG: hypothetical protein DRN27_09390 [Thermoplasmata archaeon]|nr:MAG: hypothetical protein DRN27_09390 [Thermoplasmata archaeon]
MKNNPPFVKILTDKNSGYRPVEINFDADCFDIDGEIISYEWEIRYPPFFSYQKIVNHSEKNFTERFMRPGFYEVKLTVSDDYGNEKIDYEKIQIYGSKIEQTFFSSLAVYNQINAFLNIINRIRNIIQGTSSSNIFN